MTIDPYLIKRLPRRHPKRLAYTAWARLVELHSRCFFDEYAIPMVGQPGIPEAPATDWADTQVKPEHASYLLWALHLTSAVGGCVVEVGSWRGVTTAYLAAATDSVVVAVDPYIGDKNEVNLRTFQERTKASRNVILYRLPFGEAVRRWDAGPARLIFVDAVHDYVNVRHDLCAATRLASAGAIIAVHDTDNRAFAGCRRAVYEQLERFELIAHVPDLVLLRRS